MLEQNPDLQGIAPAFPACDCPGRPHPEHVPLFRGVHVYFFSVLRVDPDSQPLLHNIVYVRHELLD